MLEVKEILKTGEILVRDGVVTMEQLHFCFEQQRQLAQIGINKLIGQIIIDNKFAGRRTVELALHEQQSVERIEVPFNIRKRFQLYVHGLSGGRLKVSSTRLLTGKDKAEILESVSGPGYTIDKIEEVIMDRSELLSRIRRASSFERDRLRDNIEKINRDPANGQILQQVINGLFIDAIESQASDIHIDKMALPEQCWISYRIDNDLNYKYLLTPEAVASLVTRLKSEAGMDISASRVPQDGRVPFSYRGTQTDMRMATIPVHGGEAVNIRILDTERLKPTKELFAHFPVVISSLKYLTDVKVKTGGLVLVTGPTGSGKTTTLYGLIRDMERFRLNILTVEDPVEYSMSGVRQSAVNPLIGFDFAAALRAQMRQDPDVIVIGEMRDSQTVEAALRSAETGQLVLTTLHTTDVKQSISRLVGMIPADYRNSGLFVVANYLKAVLNQRLARKLCGCAIAAGVGQVLKGGADSGSFHDSMEHAAAKAVAYALQISDKDIIRVPVGCEKCGGTGRSGRTLVAEAAFFPADMRLRGLMEKAISFSGQDAGEIISLEKVEYYSFANSVKELLLRGVIDMFEAFHVLNLKARVVNG